MSRSASPRTSPTPTACRPRSTRRVLAFGGIDLVVNNAGLSLSKPLLETTEKDWDLQHDVMAKGSFLVSKAAAKALIEQGLGGDIIYISSKNSVFAGPNNIAYSATKADQAHQVRLLAVELGEYGVRSTASTPTASCAARASSPSGWGANRAATYGVEEEDLGKYYAQRTILKREVRARERRQRRLRAHRTRAVAARPACTSRSTPASPPPSCDDARALHARAHALGERTPCARSTRVLAQSMCSRDRGGRP